LQTVIKCPQCGGNKIKSMKIVTSAFMWLGLICCITIIGLPIGIIFLGASLVTKLTNYHLKFNCRECKHNFKVSESTYIKYEKEIKQKEEALS
jgi:Zn finger protein HypA/HybF involved in hydrogenase expression